MNGLSQFLPIALRLIQTLHSLEKEVWLNELIVSSFTSSLTCNEFMVSFAFVSKEKYQ